MIWRFDKSHDRKDVGSLTAHVRVRVVNCSAAGCLLETDRPVEPGNVGRLRMLFSGREFEDTVQIVRCERVVGDIPVYHIGTKFLSTTPPDVESLRYHLYQIEDFAVWLDTGTSSG